jgi:methylmalonyl-CoA mutase cobalamin-binding domain/chain
MNQNELGGRIVAHADEWARAIVDLQYTRHPDLTARYGGTGYAKCLEDTRHVLIYLGESVVADSPQLFEHFIGWVRTVFLAYGVHEEDLVSLLVILREHLASVLPCEALPVVAVHIDVAEAMLRSPFQSPPVQVDPSAPHGALATQYLEVLLKSDRFAASTLIRSAVADGVSVRDVYLHVLQPVQREVGRLWQTRRISVAQEHYATAVTQLVMSQLYPLNFSSNKNGLRLVATCVGGELHELGIRMVADIFEMDGWDSCYLGANTPSESVVRTVVERNADVLAISATMTSHVPRVAAIVDAVRKQGLDHVVVMAGGYPFNLVGDLWKRVGADGYAATADVAPSIALDLVRQRRSAVHKS